MILASYINLRKNEIFPKTFRKSLGHHNNIYTIFIQTLIRIKEIHMVMYCASCFYYFVWTTFPFISFRMCSLKVIQGSREINHLLNHFILDHEKLISILLKSYERQGRLHFPLSPGLGNER